MVAGMRSFHSLPCDILGNNSRSRSDNPGIKYKDNKSNYNEK